MKKLISGVVLAALMFCSAGVTTAAAEQVATGCLNISYGVLSRLQIGPEPLRGNCPPRHVEVQLPLADGPLPQETGFFIRDARGEVVGDVLTLGIVIVNSHLVEIVLDEDRAIAAAVAPTGIGSTPGNNALVFTSEDCTGTPFLVKPPYSIRHSRPL